MIKKNSDLPLTDDTPSLYTYYSVVLGLYTLLFIDGKITYISLLVYSFTYSSK